MQTPIYSRTTFKDRLIDPMIMSLFIILGLISNQGLESLLPIVTYLWPIVACYRVDKFTWPNVVFSVMFLVIPVASLIYDVNPVLSGFAMIVGVIFGLNRWVYDVMDRVAVKTLEALLITTCWFLLASIYSIGLFSLVYLAGLVVSLFTQSSFWIIGTRLIVFVYGLWLIRDSQK